MQLMQLWIIPLLVTCARIIRCPEEYVRVPSTPAIDKTSTQTSMRSVKISDYYSCIKSVLGSFNLILHKAF